MLGDHNGLADCLEGFAVVAALQGRSGAAARLCGAADALRETAGIPLSEGDASRRARRLAPARDALGEVGFAAAWAEGRVMSLEEALAFALAPPATPTPRAQAAGEDAEA